MAASFVSFYQNQENLKTFIFSLILYLDVYSFIAFMINKTTTSNIELNWLVGVSENYWNALQPFADHCIILLAGNQTLFGWQRKMKYSSELHLWDLGEPRPQHASPRALYVLQKNDESQADVTFLLKYFWFRWKIIPSLIKVFLSSNNWEL